MVIRYYKLDNDKDERSDRRIMQVGRSWIRED